MLYQVVTFTDVQKNSEDQWYITEMKHGPLVAELSDKPTAKEACTVLKGLEVLDNANMRKLTATINEDIIDVFEKKGMKPLCRLERIS